MAHRLILDTGVLIDAERTTGLPTVIGVDDDVAIAAVSVAEMRSGIALGSPERASQRERFLDTLLETVAVEAYGIEIAITHGELMAHARRTGATRGVADLIIAATAAVTDRIIVTTDHAARFSLLPGVRCITVSGDDRPPH